MDKIWDRKSFEVGGHWPLWRGRKNRTTTQNRQNSNAKKQKTKPQAILRSLLWALPVNDDFSVVIYPSHIMYMN